MDIVEEIHKIPYFEEIAPLVLAYMKKQKDVAIELLEMTGGDQKKMNSIYRRGTIDESLEYDIEEEDFSEECK